MITERSNVPVWSAVYVLNMGKTLLCINVMTKGWIPFDGKIKLHYTANWKVRYRGEFEMTHRVWIRCFCWYCMMFVVGILATWLVGSLVFSPNVPEGFFANVKIVLWVLCCEMTAFISHWLRSPLWIVIHNSSFLTAVHGAHIAGGRSNICTKQCLYILQCPAFLQEENRPNPKFEFNQVYCHFLETLQLCICYLWC